MLLCLLLIVASPFLITAFPQNTGVSTETVQVDGFIFDGPVATRSPNEQRVSSTTSTTTAASTTSLSIDDYNACVNRCQVTPEYNPVCGSDNIDYTNPGGLGCAKICGKDVTLAYYGRCSTG
ncbi:uncharacterized protein LOC105425965 [Pogonomyrmex barbatus]|uniref:Uncharacterized protein LOC105425965 n=1 Tax=Pogonomyrmex barbatus TaxID=144034 RepID=A0A6I9W598_9HYME|nr:uncharacterized protein LOC105425965 [Pogonomyrmex barbatus]